MVACARYALMAKWADIGCARHASVTQNAPVYREATWQSKMGTVSKGIHSLSSAVKCTQPHSCVGSFDILNDRHCDSSSIERHFMSAHWKHFSGHRSSVDSSKLDRFQIFVKDWPQRVAPHLQWHPSSPLASALLFSPGMLAWRNLWCLEAWPPFPLLSCMIDEPAPAKKNEYKDTSTIIVYNTCHTAPAMLQEQNKC